MSVSSENNHNDADMEEEIFPTNNLIQIIPASSIGVINKCFGKFILLYGHQWTSDLYTEFFDAVTDNLDELSVLNNNILPKYFAAFSIPAPLKDLRIHLINILLSKMKLDHQLEPQTRNAGTKLHNEIILIIKLIVECIAGNIASDRIIQDFCKHKQKKRTSKTQSKEEELEDSVASLTYEVMELKTLIEEQST